MAQSVSDSGATHSYLLEERIGFAKFINHRLKDDEKCKKYLPIGTENEDLFSVLEDGIILCTLLNLAQDQCVDMRALVHKDNLNVYEVNRNLTLALTAAKSVGCRIPGIYPESIIEKKPHLILAVLWQLIRLINSSSIDLQSVPEIMRLA